MNPDFEFIWITIYNKCKQLLERHGVDLEGMRLRVIERLRELPN
jgi:hypothetical protein